MTYVSRQLVRFAHVDAAGIVFYPRYFEMLNAAVEDYFSDVVGVDFAVMHMERALGVPTVRIDAEFIAPSRLMDELDFVLDVRRTGRTSAAIGVEVRCGADVRLRIEVVLVCMDLKSGRPVVWPEDMRPDLVPAS